MNGEPRDHASLLPRFSGQHLRDGWQDHPQNHTEERNEHRS